MKLLTAENTPDGGKIEVNVQRGGDAQRRIFEGFWVTQDTMDYSSKQEFDFNAGGKGADCYHSGGSMFTVVFPSVQGDLGKERKGVQDENG